MKTILVDAIDAFVIENEGGFKIFKEMHDLLETFPNRKIILTGANDEQFKKFGLDKMPYEVFTLKHNPEKTDPKYYKIMLEHLGYENPVDNGNGGVVPCERQSLIHSSQVLSIHTTA